VEPTSENIDGQLVRVAECVEHGCDYAVVHGVLLARPINADDTRDDDWIEVAGVETHEEVVVINKLLGTQFSLTNLGRRP
jgi:hypothetical protein